MHPIASSFQSSSSSIFTMSLPLMRVFQPFATTASMNRNKNKSDKRRLGPRTGENHNNTLLPSLPPHPTPNIFPHSKPCYTCSSSYSSCNTTVPTQRRKHSKKKKKKKQQQQASSNGSHTHHQLSWSSLSLFKPQVRLNGSVNEPPHIIENTTH